MAIHASGSQESRNQLRQLSLTSIYHLVQTHRPRLLCARSDLRWHRELHILIDYAADYKLPKRRSYSRAVWDGYRFAFG